MDLFLGQRAAGTTAGEECAGPILAVVLITALVDLGGAVGELISVVDDCYEELDCQQGYCDPDEWEPCLLNHLGEAAAGASFIAIWTIICVIVLKRFGVTIPPGT